MSALILNSISCAIPDKYGLFTAIGYEGGFIGAYVVVEADLMNNIAKTAVARSIKHENILDRGDTTVKMEGPSWQT